MSFQPTAWLDAGLICCGLTRGITFSIRHITTMITVKNTIAMTGSQFRAQFWISCVNDVLGPDGAATAVLTAAPCAWALTSAA